MTITISGTTGLAGVDGSASTPAVQGADTNTGVFFPAADTIAWTTGGTERMRADSSGNVGIGTSSPTFASGGGLQVKNAGFTSVRVTSSSSTGIDFAQDTSANGYMYNRDNAALIFGTNNTERARIDSSGNLLVGTTSTIGTNGKFCIVATGGATNDFYVTKPSVNQYYNPAIFLNNAGTNVGYIQCSTTATTYSTSSDYRLKHDIEPMTGALAKVAQLKPVTYKWNSNNSTSQGFIAHELQAVIPDAVVGEKDAVDAEGNPQYQGIDTSFLVATLTAAIQELKAEVDALKGAQA